MTRQNVDSIFKPRLCRGSLLEHEYNSKPSMFECSTGHRNKFETLNYGFAVHLISMAVADQIPRESEKHRHDLISLQAEHSEVLYGRENEVLDKIEQEQPLTPEEKMFFFMRAFHHLQRTLERLVQSTERD